MPRGKIAPKRKDLTHQIGQFPADSAAAAVPYDPTVKTETQSALFHDAQPTKGHHDEGNQVQLGANTKGTGVAKRPSSIGVGVKDKVWPAAEVPGGGDGSNPGRKRL